MAKGLRDWNVGVWGGGGFRFGGVRGLGIFGCGGAFSDDKRFGTVGLADNFASYRAQDKPAPVTIDAPVGIALRWSRGLPHVSGNFLGAPQKIN